MNEKFGLHCPSAYFGQFGGEGIKWLSRSRQLQPKDWSTLSPICCGLALKLLLIFCLVILLKFCCLLGLLKPVFGVFFGGCKLYSFFFLYFLWCSCSKVFVSAVYWGFLHFSMQFFCLLIRQKKKKSVSHNIFKKCYLYQCLLLWWILSN